MFLSVKSCKKEDLAYVAREIGEDVPDTARISDLKSIILNSNEYKSDPDFVKGLLEDSVTERKLHEEREFERLRLKEEKELERLKLEKEQEQDMEKFKLKQQQEIELEKLKLELELAKLQAQDQNQGVISQEIPEANNVKRKFTLPKLQFRQFGDDLKDWLPFWSQFEHIDKDPDIAPENKFQYLVQATVVGSRAREVIESFPPTGENYAKAVDSLKARFGREDILVEVYVRELLKLIISVQSNQKLSPTFLYDKIETYLRALETLGVTTDKCASILYPMVESCFDEEFLKAWNRSPASNSAKDAKERLENLMLFLKGEVEGQERISLAMSGFGVSKREIKMPSKEKNIQKTQRGKIPTASMLLASSKVSEIKKPRCIFCSGKHASSDCFNAQKLTLEEKQKIVRDKNCCFACLLPGHSVRKCHKFLKCPVCSKKHVILMCDQFEALKNTNQKKEEEENSSGNDVNLSNVNTNPKVFLQTFKAKLLSGDKEKTVRILCDSGSQRSYIVKSIAEEMKYPISRQETIKHSLFGGVSTKECKHNCYRIRLQQLNGNFTCNFEVLDQVVICENVLPVSNGPWLKELRDLGIILTDSNVSCESIDVLIGADIMGKLLTGKREQLTSGLVAVETQLGWTLMGKVPQINSERVNLAMTVTSLFVKEAEISDLWRLDVIGIRDPMEKLSKHETDLKVKDHFKETVKLNQDNRYEICLPWADDSSPLPDNFNLAKKRLEVTTEKLLSRNLYDKYEKVFQEWLDEGIIEEVPSHEVSSFGHYLPHRPVIKESSSTTPIRPVFDASAKFQGHPSLNQCLQCGPNLIELIPDILARFRARKFGVTADIRKAFLQISVSKEDRDYLRFLWWKNLEEKKLKVFRHTRVVFGVKSSPFLLASVIEYHIETYKGFDSEFKNLLKQSFYVDNVVASLDSHEDLNDFISKSAHLMSQGGFELRDWESTGSKNEHGWETPVLGIKWNRKLDCLSVNMSWMDDLNFEKLTKRIMLSAAHKVFDPIGFTAPVMLCPKLMLQKAWKMSIGWDAEITGDLRKEFLRWFQNLKILEEINIPRWINVTAENLKHCTIHTFCDASKEAYAAVVFLRIEEQDSVKLSLLAAKSRIAPLRGGTIPRMELLAALIGARLTNSVVEALNWKEVKCYYWSDSTTVLAWICREENWSVFVRNRVQEIRKLTSPLAWNHIAGELNPADLASRGCTAEQLMSSRWWEGPHFLKEPLNFWSHDEILCEDFNEAEIENEKLKSTKSLVNAEKVVQCTRIFSFFSKYQQIVRLIGWMLRFKNNCLCTEEKRTRGELTSSEFEKAELKLVLMIQQESFEGEDDKKFKSLAVFVDEDKILRVKTQIINRKDEEDFRKPMVLPSSHEVVFKLIEYYHKKNLHCGLHILQNILREKFWILNGRKTIRKVISKCIICKRFSSKRLEVDSGPLPENRVRDAAVFQVTGIDTAGPLFLRGNQKAWVLLFTCAVYRAVHLELITSLSTEAFLMAFRRFVARRGRCSTIYCDNGKNFVGAANLLRGLDWNKIIKHCSVNAIDWKFNPPTASWWGGFWERLIRILKDLLKRVLGQAQLLYEEMTTILCDCEALINSRPLTYVSESDNLVPISPSSFLQDIKEWETPDIDAIDHKSLNRRLKYRQNLQRHLRNRFRNEYLGLLVQKQKCKDTRKLAVGDIVFVGADNCKRINWPLGRIIDVIPGKDGIVRLVKIQTQHSQLLRPVQRVYPLEISTENDFLPPMKIDRNKSSDAKESPLSDCKKKLSKSGREIKVPVKLNL